MKKLMSIFLLSSAFFLVVSCTNQENTQVVQVLKKTDTEIKQEKLLISQILDNLAAANESGNFEMIKNTWLQSEDVLLIGTENDEKLEGWEEIKAAVKKQFSSFNETLISITD
ncbi:MAG: nuclear transport factor 2 family protein, partial [Bacteroidales bacterium]|nr:nuclear transport factor 2 family protein [Bacteroidales bacterium]